MLQRAWYIGATERVLQTEAARCNMQKVLPTANSPRSKTVLRAHTTTTSHQDAGSTHTRILLSVKDVRADLSLAGYRTLRIVVARLLHAAAVEPRHEKDVLM